MVSGLSIAVTKVPLVSQCADMQSMALGTGKAFAAVCQPLVNSFSSMAFIGLPCPTNNTGIVSVLPKGSTILCSAFNFIAAAVKGNKANDFRKSLLSIIQ